MAARGLDHQGGNQRLPGHQQAQTLEREEQSRGRCLAGEPAEDRSEGHGHRQDRQSVEQVHLEQDARQVPVAERCISKLLVILLDYPVLVVPELPRGHGNRVTGAPSFGDGDGVVAGLD